MPQICLIPQDIPVTCDGCGKRFSIEHALSCPKGGLVLEWHDDAEKEWAPLEPGPSFLVLLPTNLKSIVGQYRGEDWVRSAAGEWNR